MRIRLGPDFAKLWTASTVSNLGDGVTLVAGPLLAASLTHHHADWPADRGVDPPGARRIRAARGQAAAQS